MTLKHLALLFQLIFWINNFEIYINYHLAPTLERGSQSQSFAGSSAQLQLAVAQLGISHSQLFPELSLQAQLQLGHADSLSTLFSSQLQQSICALFGELPIRMAGIGQP